MVFFKVVIVFAIIRSPIVSLVLGYLSKKKYFVITESKKIS